MMSLDERRSHIDDSDILHIRYSERKKPIPDNRRTSQLSNKEM